MKNVFSWLSIYLIGPIWFLTATLFAFFAIANPGVIKTALSDNNTYQKLIPAGLDIAQKDNNDNGKDALPLNEPGVQTAINKAFPPDDLKAKSETVIDSVFIWLDGKTAKPQFSLDFTNNKQLLASELGNYTATRAASLPPCTVQDVQAAQSNNDVFSIKCLPPGVTPAQAGQEATSKIANNKDFLKDPVVTSDTFKAGDTNLGDKNFNAEPFRKFYQKKSLLSILLPTLVLALAALGTWLAPTRMLAIKRLERVFLMSVVGMSLVAVGMYFGSRKLNNNFASDNLSTGMVIPVVSSLIHHAMVVYIVFAAISLVLTVGLFTATKRLSEEKKPKRAPQQI
jgi:hypothetical protein